MRVFVTAAVFVFCAAMMGCQSAKQIENSFDQAYADKSVDLIFMSPNFSAFHSPPLISGFAYVESYDKSVFCEDDEAVPIGKVTVTRANRTQISKLPVGKILLNVGYHSAGISGGGLTGNTYTVVTILPNQKYEIVLMEARPLVTSYTVDVSRIDEAGARHNVELASARTKRQVCAT